MSFFNAIVNTGIDERTPAHRTEEVKLMNSLSFHSIVLSLCTAVAAFFLIPDYWLISAVIALTEAIAKVCVILLNNLHKYVLAKVIFSLITMFLFLIVIFYFGTDTNFQYVGLTVLFGLIFIFRNGRTEDLVIFLTYFVIGTIIFGYLLLTDTRILILSAHDVKMIRLIAFLVNGSLVVIMAVIFFKYSRSLAFRELRSKDELSKVATILRTISVNLTDGIFKTHPDHGFVFVNRAFAQIYGYTDEDDIMQRSPEALYRNAFERNELIREIKSSQGVVNKLMPYLKKDGTQFWGRLSCKLIEESGTHFIVGTVTDVTTQQMQDFQLKESESQLKEAQHMAKLGNWQLNVETKKLSWSAGAISVFGYSPLHQQNAFEHWLDKFDTLNAARIEALIAKSMVTNDAVEFSSWYTTADGERKFLNFVSHYKRTLKIEGGLWYGTVQDYTEQKIAESKLKETQLFFESIIDRLPIEAVMIDEKGCFTFLSESAVADRELRKWLIGKRNVDYAAYRKLDPAFAVERDRMIQLALNENRSLYFEERLITKEGKDTFHLRFLFPLEFNFSSGKKTQLIGYSLDVNQIKRSQFELESKNDELKLLNKELDRFVYSISHDLRAPIATALGLIGLWSETADEDGRNQLIQMQRESLVRLESYVSDVIDYTRNKRLEVKHEQVNVAELARKCVQDLSFYQAHEQFNIEIEVPNELYFVSDALRLKIILNNLLSNAVKYRDENKANQRVRLYMGVKDDQLQIIVEDNGIGIKSDYIEQVWQMFFRATSIGSGSGLGLYILKEAVEALNGSVSVESEERVRTIFQVSIPAAESSVS